MGQLRGKLPVQEIVAGHGSALLTDGNDTDPFFSIGSVLINHLPRFILILIILIIPFVVPVILTHTVGLKFPVDQLCQVVLRLLCGPGGLLRHCKGKHHGVQSSFLPVFNPADKIVLCTFYRRPGKLRPSILQNRIGKMGSILQLSLQRNDPHNGLFQLLPGLLIIILCQIQGSEISPVRAASPVKKQIIGMLVPLYLLCAQPSKGHLIDSIVRRGHGQRLFLRIPQIIPCNDRFGELRILIDPVDLIPVFHALYGSCVIAKLKDQIIPPAQIFNGLSIGVSVDRMVFVLLLDLSRQAFLLNINNAFLIPCIPGICRLFLIPAFRNKNRLFSLHAACASIQHSGQKGGDQCKRNPRL